MNDMAQLAEIFDQTQSLLDARRSLRGQKGPWLIYGKGKQGRKVARVLMAAGHGVLGFMDKAAIPDEKVDGLPCWHPRAEGLDKSIRVAVALHNPMHSSLRAKLDLGAMGFQTVHLLQDMVDAFVELEHYWLAPSSRSLAERERFAEALIGLRDGESKAALLGMLGFRLLGRPAPEPEPDQYFPLSVPKMADSLRMVDCGAFVGDTLDWIESNGMRIEWAMAFEPDPENFKALSKKWSGKAMLMPCGVSDKMEMASFVQDGAAGCLGSQEGSISIQMASIDESVGSAKVNFIKMDVEGAELGALAGAQRTIRRFNPRMAIASYHDPMHVWMIMDKCRACGFKGDFMLRAHCENTFDMVLYALPGEAR